MIKKIIIENYQSHKRTEIGLSKGINIFIGKSDSGKSAILRSVIWNKDNRPTGDVHMRRGEESFSCTIIAEKEIVRKRDKKFNGYIVDGEEYDAGKDVPIQVSKALNLSDINIQHQFDNHFLLTSTPGSIAEYLNTVVDLEVIDDAIDGINKKVRGLEKGKKLKENELGESQKALEGLSYLDTLVAAVEALEIVEESAAEDEDKLDGLINLNERLIAYKKVFDKEADYKVAIDYIDKLITLDDAVDDLESDKICIEDNHRNIKILEKKIKDENDYKQALEEIGDYEEKVQLLIKADDKFDAISLLNYNIIDYKSDLKDKKEEIAECEAEYSENDVGVCPFCGQEYCEEVAR